MNRFSWLLALPILLAGLTLDAGRAQATIPDPTPAPSESVAPDPTPTPEVTPGDSIVSIEVGCEERVFVFSGPVNEVGGLGRGTPGQIGILRTSCTFPDGTESWHRDEQYVWTVRPKTEEFPVVTPSDWPWSAERIAEERAVIELDAQIDGVPVVYPPYLTDEFLTTGKIMTHPNGTASETWALQP